MTALKFNLPVYHYKQRLLTFTVVSWDKKENDLVLTE